MSPASIQIRMFRPQVFAVLFVSGGDNPHVIPSRPIGINRDAGKKE
jgi:hypothetical protein